MCGICGIYGFSDENLVKTMCDILKYRGPDDSGYHFDDNVGLGHRRLSIIDLEKGHQPVYNEDGSICIVFNGEIYNYKKLRNLLSGAGHTFATSSDTEIIVHMYEEYGLDFLRFLSGMFSFAIWDSSKKILLIARDRLGEKPLYYTLYGNSLIFASEIKALLAFGGIEKEIDLTSVDYFLKYRYIPGPFTLIKSISKLLPGHYVLCREKKITVNKFWDINTQNLLHKTEKFYIDTTSELLSESVKDRLVSDVPLGAFLSGGVDSSAIVGLMSKMMNEPVKTFSVGFEEEGDYNELKYAREIAEHFNTDHHEIIVKSSDILKDLPGIIWHLDEPIVDPAAVPTFFVSALAKRHVKVVLNGEGADELFAGYKDYKSALRNAQIRKFMPEPIRKTIIKVAGNTQSEKMKENIQLILDEKKDHVLWQPLFTDAERKTVLRYTVNSAPPSQKYFNEMKTDLLNKMLYVDLKTWIPDNSLLKVDRMTMAHSIEGRVPFLDHGLVEFAMSIPQNFKLKNYTGKYILRKTVENVVPRGIAWRKKHGFSVPLQDWIQKDLKNSISDVIQSKEFLQRGYVNKYEIEKLMKSSLNSRNSFKMWSLFVLEMWNKMYMDGEKCGDIAI